MGGVRRMLPRVAILTGAATGAVLFLTVRGAGAQDTAGPDPVDQVGGAVTSLLPSTPDPTSDPVPAPPVSLPDLSKPASALSAPVQTVSDATAPVLDTAQLPAASPLPTGPLPAAGPAVAAPTGAVDSLVGAASAPDAGLTVASDPLGTTAIPVLVAGPSSAARGAALPAASVDPLEVPALLPAPADGTSAPSPFAPAPPPVEPAGAFLRPATAPSTTTPGPERATGATGTVSDSPNPMLTFLLEAIEHAFSDPGSGTNPARGPPDEPPRDPSHRGSSDHVPHEFSLPGTDRIGVTRAESWQAGTDVELSNTSPEPSVSPD